MEKYEDRIDKLLTKTSSNTTINNTKYENVINCMEPLTYEHIYEQSKKFLTLEHLTDGITGLCNFAGEYPFKDRVICVDFSRKKVVYKDAEGNTVNDPSMIRLVKLFCQAIEEQNSVIADERIEELRVELNGTLDCIIDDPVMKYQADRITDDISNLQEILKIVNSGSKGNFPKLLNQFTQRICNYALMM